jgi:integrase
VSTKLNSHTRSNFFSEVMEDAIYNLQLPDALAIKTGDRFDDSMIKTCPDRWKFQYSGSTRYLIFDFGSSFNRLAKYVCFSYASRNHPTALPHLIYSIKKVFIECGRHKKFTFDLIVDFITQDDFQRDDFYYSVFFLKVLCVNEFPGFSLKNYESLDYLPRPKNDMDGIYSDIDNVLTVHEKDMLSRGLIEVASKIRKDSTLKEAEIRDASISGIMYCTGARPSQIAALSVEDIQIDARLEGNGTCRYSLNIPYAKKRKTKTKGVRVAVSPELGDILMRYISISNLKRGSKLFPITSSAPRYTFRCLNRFFLSISSDNYKQSVSNGSAAPPMVTPSDLRHNVGHSLAMQGASAEEIAHIMGHSSLTPARYYISATPALAIVRSRALGVNPVWKNMIAMLLTGKLTEREKWNGKRVAGVIGGDVHAEVGGCSREDGNCPFSEVRSCYGCLYYRPFLEGDHNNVLKSVTREMDDLVEISDAVGNSRNPLISVHETTKAEIEAVIARCALHGQHGGSA